MTHYPTAGARKRRENLLRGSIPAYLKRTQRSLATLLAPIRREAPLVDKICINQESKPEQAAQVRRMGATYSEACEILVWLGEEDDETATVFELIADIGQQIQEFRQNPETMRAFESAAVRDGTNHFSLNLTSADSAE